MDMKTVTEINVIGTLLTQQPRLTIIASGAGAGIQNVLWRRPGASKFLSGAYFPYAPQATADLLGFMPVKAVSRETAIAMAMEAYTRSCRDPREGKPMGLGLTAAVTTDRERRGKNCVAVALITPEGASFSYREFHKDLGDANTARVVDGLNADACAFDILYDYFQPFDVVEATARIDPIPEEELMAILYERPLFLPNGTRPLNWKEIVDSDFGAIIPTSGNPPHDGHYGMAAETARVWRTNAVFAVTADSVHKPALKATDLLQRVAYFRSGNVPVVLTRRDPLFIHKALQFPGKTFGIGVDTMERLLEPKWLRGPDGEPIDGIPKKWLDSGEKGGIWHVLNEFDSMGTRFLVFDRDGKSCEDEDIVKNVPIEFRHLFDRGRGTWDISSSRLRAQKAASP